MPGLGTIVNAIAILLGGGIGLLFKRGIPDRFQQILFSATGLMALIMGISGFVSASFTAAADGSLNAQYGMVMLLSLILGSILGEAMQLNKGFERMGAFLQKCFASSKGTGSFRSDFLV